MALVMKTLIANKAKDEVRVTYDDRQIERADLDKGHRRLGIYLQEVAGSGFAL
jgi:hypothetical protein